MNYPCVELYFDVETGPLFIRVWMKTNNILHEGDVETKYVIECSEVKSSILRQGFQRLEDAVIHLSNINTISAFQVGYRSELNNPAVVVYMEL